MLHTVGIVLSIIGIVLLCIISFILVLAFMIIFISSRYKIFAYYHNNNYKITVKAAWMFGVVGYSLNFNNDNFLNYFTILGIQIKKKKDSNKDSNKNITPINNDNLNHDKKDTISLTENEQEFHSDNTNKKINKKNRNNKREKKKKKFLFKEFSKNAKKIIYKIKDVIDFLKNENNKEVFIFLKLKLFKLLNHIKPQKIKGQITLGFDDPSKTGYALGVIALIFGYIGNGLTVNPDFENSIIDGELFLKGRIRAFNLLIITWKCYRNKKIRKSFNDLMRLKD